MRTTLRGPDHIADALRLVAVCVGTFVLAYLCLILPRGAAQIAPIWLPNAVALALLLLSRRSRWTGIAIMSGLGNFLASVAVDAQPVIAATLAICNTFQFVGCAILLVRVLGRAPDMSKVGNLCAYALVAAGASLISAGLAVAVLSGLGSASGWAGFATWAMADLAGLLIVTPCVMALATERRLWRRLTSREAWPLAVLLVVALCTFLQDRYPLAYLVVAALLLVTWRGHLAGAAAGVLATLAIAVTCTVLGRGPFAVIDGSLVERVMALQLFLASCFYLSIPVAAQGARASALRDALAQALAEAQEAEARYRLIAERAHDIIVRADLSGKFLYVSPSCRAFGYEPEELIGTHGADLVHPDDLARLADNTAQLVRDGVVDHTRQRQHRFRCKDGRYVWLEGSPTVLTDEAGQAVELLNVFRDITERKLAETELAAKDAELETLTNHAPDLLVRIDSDDRVVYASPACRQFGYEPEELVGRLRRDLVHPEDLERLGRSLATRLEGGHPEQGDRQYRILRSDGSWTWVEGSLSLVHSADGDVVGAVSLLRDISQRRAAAEALAASEARYRLLTDNMTDVIACFDREGVLTFLSPAVKAILGYEASELVGRSIVGLMHPDDVEPNRQALRDRFKAGPDASPFRLEYRLFRKDGAMIWLEAQPRAIYDSDTGEFVEWQDAVRDITQAMAIRAALADSEARFRLFTENANDLIVQSDPTGRITYMSPSCEMLTGYAPEEILGLTAHHFIHPDDADALSSVFAGQIRGRGAAPPVAVEYRIRTKDGRYIWLEARPQAIVDPVSGHVTSVTDVARDITERKVLEEQLRAARAEAEAAVQVKSEFLANMSHELRTPLTSVVGFTELAMEQPELTPLTRTYVSRISDAGRALLSTVNDILDFSKLEAGQVTLRPEPVQLQRLARSALDLFQPQAGAKDLRLSLESDLPENLTLMLDPDRVRQILLNLIGNAVKFTETGGVTLSLAFDEAAETLTVAVRDTGAGIPEDRLDRLFKRFSQVDGTRTRSHGGTGLGLAICKGIVEAMGGSIVATSTPGEGSCFSFTVPAPLTALACDGVGGQPLQAVTFSGVRVLVVDDHPANRELAGLFLAGVGAQVFEAEDGVQAAELAAQWPYDVILMDLRMPRLDGPGALRLIRSRHGPNAATPILAFTADADPGSLPGMLDLGFQGVVSKPVSPAELISAIAEAIVDAGPELREAS